MRRLASTALRCARAAAAARSPPPPPPPAFAAAWRPAPRASAALWRLASAMSSEAAAAASADPVDTPSPDAAPPPPPKPHPYAVDFTALAALVAAVRLAAVPGRLDDVVAVDRATLALRLTVAGDADATTTAPLWLWLAWGVHPRLAVGPPPPPGGAAAAGVDAFADKVRAELRGRVLVGAEIGAAFDRVARLDFGARVGAPADRLLILEANGRKPNVALVDCLGAKDGGGGGDGAPAGSKKKKKKSKAPQTAPPLFGVPPPPPRPGTVLAVPPGAAPVRVRAPGAKPTRLDPRSRYTPPTRPAKIAPCLSEPADVWRGNVAAAAGQLADAGKDASVRAALVATYAGVSPSLAADLVAAVGFFGAWHVPAAALTDDDWGKLHAQWARWLTAVSADQWAPGTRADGRPSVLGQGTDEAPAGSKEAVLAAAAAVDAATVEAVAAVGAAAAPGAAGELADSLTAAVAKELARSRNALASMREQADTASQADALFHQAGLLESNLHAVPAGAASIDVEDWQTGQTVTIALDPPRPPAAVLKDMYTNARKRRRAADAVAPRLAVSQQTESYLAGVLAELEADPPPPADRLVALRNELASAGLLTPWFANERSAAGRGAAVAARAATAERKRFRRFTAPSGADVLLGRNNRENDDLSLKAAAPHDVWLHARGVPGAHAILRVPASAADADPDPADLAFAAALAAFYSKARDATVADVSWTRARAVRKPRGAPPGAVTLLEERVTAGVPADGADAVKAAGESDGE